MFFSLFFGRYKRVFSVGTKGVTTYNPSSMEITNQVNINLIVGRGSIFFSAFFLAPLIKFSIIVTGVMIRETHAFIMECVYVCGCACVGRFWHESGIVESIHTYKLGIPCRVRILISRLLEIMQTVVSDMHPQLLTSIHCSYSFLLGLCVCVYTWGGPAPWCSTCNYYFPPLVHF